MNLRDLARAFAADLEEIRTRAGVLVDMVGDIPVRTLYDARAALSKRADRLRTVWLAEFAPLSLDDRTALFRFRTSTAPTGAALTAVQTAIDNLSAAITADMDAVHGGVERTWDDVAKAETYLTVTKAQRATTDTRLTELRSAIAALVT